jgi:hypothetical protein
MAGQTWSITITGGSETSPASFVPDVYTEGSPQSALQAQNGDIISWNNQTNLTHQPWQTDASYVIGSGANAQLSDAVSAFASSQPGFCPDQDETPSTIYYACKTHPNLPEHGQIDVVG